MADSLSQPPERNYWRPVTSLDAFNFSDQEGSARSYHRKHSTRSNDGEAGVEQVNPLHDHAQTQGKVRSYSVGYGATQRSSTGRQRSDSMLHRRERVIKYQGVKTGIKPRSIIWHYRVSNAICALLNGVDNNSSMLAHKLL